MKRINMFILAIVLALIFLAVEVVIVKGVSKYEPEINVVFAAQRIPMGETITEDMLEKRKISLRLAHNKSVKNIEELIGKKVISDIEEGEIILISRVGDKDGTGEIVVVDRNSRLITVEFKGDQVNGWQLKEGQFVDIIFILDERSTIPEIEDITWFEDEKRIRKIRDIRVAALIDDKGKPVGSSESSSMPKYISFEVEDGLDQFLAFAKGNGRLEISLIPERD